MRNDGLGDSALLPGALWRARDVEGAPRRAFPTRALALHAGPRGLAREREPLLFKALARSLLALSGCLRVRHRWASVVLALSFAMLLAGCGSASGHPRPRVALSTSASQASGSTGPAGGAAVDGSSAVQADDRPNIVFVLTDDLARNLVRYMPHVKAMEREGESFSNYFVTDSLCCPSRASIFTGRYPHQTKIFSNTPPNGGFKRFHRRGEARQTFAVQLKDHGYLTAMMGKYMNGYRPSGREGGLTPYVPPGWSEWDVAGDGYPEFGYQMNSNHAVHVYRYKPSEYLTDVIAQKGLSFIGRAAATRKPFMLELATFAPHAPYVPAPRDAHRFAHLTAPKNPSFDVRNTHPAAWLRPFRGLTGADRRTINADFRLRVRSVQAVDRMIGKVEAKLAKLHIRRNTYIVFSSDNGLHMGEHMMMPGKLTAFDSDVHVPLIVVGPGVPKGRAVPEMSENIDLCPTFEQIAKAGVPSTVDGHSLLALLEGRKPRGWRKDIFVEHRKPLTTVGDPDAPIHGSGNPPSYDALRTDDSLYVHYLNGEQEYYDLKKDPFEMHNVVGGLSNRRLAKLHKVVYRLHRCTGARSCWRAAGGGLLLRVRARAGGGLLPHARGGDGRRARGARRAPPRVRARAGDERRARGARRAPPRVRARARGKRARGE